MNFLSKVGFLSAAGCLLALVAGFALAQSNLSEISGWYGTDKKHIDISAALQAVYSKYGTIAVPGGYMNNLFGDPAPGDRKYCVVSFKEAGNQKTIRVQEYDEIAHPSAVANKDEVAGIIRDALKIANEVALITAAGDNNVAEVQSLLNKGVDVNTKLTLSRAAAAPLSNAPLLQAAWTGALDVVKLLIEKGADVNISEENGTQPLHWAARNGHLEIVKLLLAKGANMNLQESENPLDFALQSGNSAVIKELINLKDADGDTSLMNAVEAGDLEKVKVLLAQGADVNLDNQGKTALHMVNDVAIAQELIKHKAHVHAVSGLMGMMPLHFAAARGNEAVARILLNNGARADAKANGKTAYDLAVAQKNKNLMTLLFDTASAAKAFGTVYSFDGTSMKYADAAFAQPFAFQSSPKANDVKKIERISAAWYGFDGFAYNVDVTSKLQGQLVQNGGFLTVPVDMNSYFGSDPIPNQRKVLAIQVVIDGKAFDLRIPEGKGLTFPVPVVTPAPAPVEYSGSDYY